MERANVTRSVEDAAALIKDGMTVATGGLLFANHPMPIIRQMIRNGVRNLTLVGPASSGLDVDLLIGAGCVTTLISPYVSGESLIGYGPCYRQAVERGEMKVWEVTEGLEYMGLRAAALGLPFLPYRGGVGSDIPKLNPEIKEFRDPIKGELLCAVPAIKPDVALIHVQRSDCYGNGQHLGSTYGDRLMAHAADCVILTCDKLVSNEVIRRTPLLTTIAYATVVVETAFGSHPYASHGLYGEDTEVLREYVEAAESRRTGNPDKFARFLDKYIHGPADHFAYLDLVGAARLVRLAASYDDLVQGG
ncbi:MAG: CoA transferase subunit A [Candidatus Tectomicrobia bacterium]|nr:CoA transferase subunit A [Candidatus Tectomicrobia bacterium]